MGSSGSSLLGHSIYADMSIFKEFSQGLVNYYEPDTSSSCQWTSMSEDIKNTTSNMRYKIIRELTGNPLQFANQFIWFTQIGKSNIKKDDPCRCEFVSRVKEEGKCDSSCQIIKALGPAGKVGIPYIAQCDSCKTNPETERFIVKSSKAKEVTMTIVDSSYIMERFTTNFTKMLAYGCSGDIPNYMLGSSEFINETLIGYALEYIMNPLSNVTSLQYSKTPFRAHTYIQQYDAFICSSKKAAYNVMELADLGDLSEFLTNLCDPVVRNDTSKLSEILNQNTLENIVLNVCKQIVVTLCYLQTYYAFTHSDLKAKNVFVRSLDRTTHPSVVDYGEYHVENLGFVVCIADYGKCAISLPIRKNTQKFVRLHTTNTSAEFALENFRNFTPDVRMSDSERTFFVIPDKPKEEEIITLGLFFLGLPTYSSLDTYCIIMSMLLVNQRITDIMFSNNNIVKMMSTLWEGNALNSIKQEVDATLGRDATDRPLKERMRIKYTYKRLKGKPLYCDASKRAMRKLFSTSHYSDVAQRAARNVLTRSGSV